MVDEKRQSKIFIVLTKYMRLDDVIRWMIISFLGFILGITTLTLQAFLLPFGVFLVVSFCCMAFIFSINNYYDADSDRANPRRMHKNALASGEISNKSAMTINILCVVIPLLILAVFRPIALVAAILLLIWSATYSVPPVRVKGRPGLDIIWHFFGFLYIVLLGALIAGSLSELGWLMALSLGVFSCIGQLANHYDDFEYDKESGTTTFAVRYGLDGTKKAIEVVLGIHLVVLLVLVILYSSRSLITLLLLVGICILGFVLVKPKRDGFPTKKSYEYYLSTIVAGAVYLSILVYHILMITGSDLIPVW
ncbi:MAG TPA: UbiA prenyltransferase family protein [Candidatus Thermoplasmatota archaeon]|nr:UbiA prenyltransferase family protein [Candidatus Thermoplasmatota archaeon]